MKKNKTNFVQYLRLTLRNDLRTNWKPFLPNKKYKSEDETGISLIKVTTIIATMVQCIVDT